MLGEPLEEAPIAWDPARCAATSAAGLAHEVASIVVAEHLAQAATIQGRAPARVLPAPHQGWQSQLAVVVGTPGAPSSAQLAVSGTGAQRHMMWLMKGSSR
jgi:hypothetical protein